MSGSGAKSPALRPGWVSPSHAALLLIDCQVDFAAPDGAMAKAGANVAAAQAAILKTGQLADAARGRGVACIFTRLISVPGRETRIAREAMARRGEERVPPLCVEGSRGADFAGPRPGPGDLVLDKSLYSAFTGTGLAETLRARGLDTLVLCGLTTECCVQSTAWEAFERDLHVFIAVDACAAYEEGLHRIALKSLGLSGAILAETAQFQVAWKQQ